MVGGECWRLLLCCLADITPLQWPLSAELLALLYRDNKNLPKYCGLVESIPKAVFSWHFDTKNIFPMYVDVENGTAEGTCARRAPSVPSGGARSGGSMSFQTFFHSVVVRDQNFLESKNDN